MLSEGIAKELLALVKEICRNPVFSIGEGAERKLLTMALRSIHRYFECDASSIFLWKRSRSILTKICGNGEHMWDSETLFAFFHNRKPHLPDDIVMAPVRRGNNVIGVLALRRENGFEKGDGKITTEFLRIFGCLLGLALQSRISRMCLRLNCAMSLAVSPKDIIYRVMHNLRRLIDYDHGATLLLRKGDHSGYVFARQVAWKKGKSEIVGREIDIDWSGFASPGIRLIRDDDWLMDVLRSLSEDGAPPKKTSIIEFIFDDGEPIGLFEIGSAKFDFFVDKDLEILDRFFPIIDACTRNLRSTGGERAWRP